MEVVEDSGFDSDQRTSSSTSMANQDHPLAGGDTVVEQPSTMNDGINSTSPTADAPVEVSFSRPHKKPSGLQRKIEKQRQASLKLHSTLHQQQQKSGSGVLGVLSRSRLAVPGKQTDGSTEGLLESSQPLVVIDESDDEFAASSRLWRRSSAPVSDMVRQLATDGYDLDLQPDDSDLDLIPPRPLNERRCLCCYNGSPRSACSLQ